LAQSKGRIETMLTNDALSQMRKPHDPAGRGYHAVYREHEINHCPGCGRTHWLIGRVSAECAFCTTALPLAEASMRSHNRPIIIQHKNRAQDHAWAA
jgi:hypothetical protein